MNPQNDGYPTPHCPDSDTLQSLMKILLYLVKQEEKRTDTSKIDKIREAIALYKQYLLSSKLTRESLALLNKLIKIEKTIQNYPKLGSADKITVKFELPVPSQPRCLKELNNIVLKVHDAYAKLKSSGICRRNEEFDERISPVGDFTNGAPTLQDNSNGNPSATPSGDPDKFDPESMNIDIYSFLNNYRPKKYNPDTKNEPFINNDLFSQLVEDPKLTNWNQTIPDQNNPHVDDNDEYRNVLLSLLNSKEKESIQKPTDGQNDLLSLVLNKIKDYENNKPSQNQGSFKSHTNLNSILHGILDSRKGHLGPSDDLIYMQHLPNFGEADPTQHSLLHNLEPNLDYTEKTKSKWPYPNPLQDPPLTLETVDNLNSVYTNFQDETSLLKPNTQDIKGLELESKYLQQQPYDINQLNRISDKLKNATFLADNFNNNLKKEEKKPVLKHDGGFSNKNFLRVSPNQNPTNVYEGDEINPEYYKEKNPTLLTEFLPYTFSRFDEKPEEELNKKYPQMYNDVPGGETIYKLMTSPNQTGVLELTYLLNRPVSMAEPFHFVKYKIPYETFALNFKQLIREQFFRPKTAEMFYKDLLVKSSSEIINNSSSARRSTGNVYITDQVLKNGTLLDAKILNDNYSSNGIVVVTVKALPSNEEVKSLSNVLNWQKLAEGENSYPYSQPLGLGAHNKIGHPDRRRNYERDNDDDVTASESPLQSVDELINKLKEIWSTDLLKISRSHESVKENLTPMSLSDDEENDNNKSDENY